MHGSAHSHAYAAWGELAKQGMRHCLSRSTALTIDKRPLPPTLQLIQNTEQTQLIPT